MKYSNSIYEKIIALSETNRFSNKKLINNESVLEHTAANIILSSYIANFYIELKIEISIEAIMFKSMVHDFDELYTGDVIMPVKHYNKNINLEFKKIEEMSILKIFQDFPNNHKYISSWQISKSGFDGAIVSLSDVLCVLYKIYNEYFLKGNVLMLSCISTHENYSNFIKSKFSDLIFLDKRILENDKFVEFMDFTILISNALTEEFKKHEDKINIIR